MFLTQQQIDKYLDVPNRMEEKHFIIQIQDKSFSESNALTSMMNHFDSKLDLYPTVPFLDNYNFEFLSLRYSIMPFTVILYSNGQILKNAM
jgi:hypothetical protein